MLEANRTLAPEQTLAVLPWVTGRFYAAGHFGHAGISTVDGHTSNPGPYISYIPHFQPNPMTWLTISVCVRTAGAVSTPLEIGYYSWNPDTNMPGDLIRDFGQVDLMNLGVQSININEYVRQGLYYVSLRYYTGDINYACYGIDRCPDILGTEIIKSSSIENIGATIFNSANVRVILPMTAKAEFIGLTHSTVLRNYATHSENMRVLIGV